jgi:C-terminal processing protease CtpA/Prc
MWRTLIVTGLLPVVATLLPLVAVSQESVEETERALERAAREAEAAELAAEREARFDEARARLEAAAREIAALSGEVAGEVASEVMEHFQMDSRRAYLGINVGPADAERGVEVLGVTPGGPANEADVRTGDVIVSIGGEDLVATPGSSAVSKLTAHMRGIESGETVELRLERDGQERTASVVAGALEQPVLSFAFGDEELDFDPEAFGRKVHSGFIGRWGDLELVELTPELGDYFGTEEGLLVVRKPRDATLKLMEGDVILDIGGRRPSSPEHAMRILRSYEPGEELEMAIIRKGRRQTLAVALPTGSDRAARSQAMPHRPTLPVRMPPRRHAQTST